MKRIPLLLLVLLGGLVAACQAETTVPDNIPTSVPTSVALAPATSTGVPDGPLPATWTPSPATTETPTVAPYLSPTVAPSRTAWSSSPTPTATPSATPVPADTATPTDTPPPTAVLLPTTTASAGGANMLPNGSFEGGWYNIGGVPELQVAEQWQLTWREGDNALDPDPWNEWVRPESRVLPSDFLPPSERDLFIRDGDQTVKIFKGRGSINFELTTEVFLPAGRYRLEVYVYPDLVVDYRPDGSKIFADDVLSGEVRFIDPAGGTGWMLPAFGQWNRLTHDFDVSEPRTVRLGMGIRGRWAIENNGWFMDQWSLRRLGG